MELVPVSNDLPSSVPASVGPPRESLLRLSGHGAAVTGLSFHPSQPLLASSSFDASAIIWSLPTGTIDEAPARAHLTGHTASVTAVAYCAGGDCIATASADTTAAVYDAVTAQRVRTLRGHASHMTSVDGGVGVVDRAAGSASAFVLLTGGNDRKACVWDTREQGAHRRGASVTLEHEYQVLDVALGREDWTVFSSGIDPRVFMWDLRCAEKPLRYLEAHGDAVTGLAVSPLGQHLASYGADGRVAIWDVRPFVQGGDEARLERALDCGDGAGFEKEMMRCGWDRCGTRVAAGDAGGAVVVWDTADGEEEARLGGHDGSVNDVKFCPIEDTLLASASSDSTIIVGHLPLATD